MLNFFVQVYSWIKNVGDDFLNNNTVMGDSIKTSQEFWYLHKELDSEKEVNKCLHSLMHHTRTQSVTFFCDKPHSYIRQSWFLLRKVYNCTYHFCIPMNYGNSTFPIGFKELLF